MSDEWIVVLEEDTRVEDLGDRSAGLTIRSFFKAVPVGTEDLFDTVFRRASSAMTRDEAVRLATEMQLMLDVLES